MSGQEFLTTEEAAAALDVSVRHVRRLVESRAIERVAQGLVDRTSVDRYLLSHRQGRTRVWAEHTAWGAVAVLSGRKADWLGSTQVSRLRQQLRSTHDVNSLLTRTRERHRVRTYTAHRAALPRLRDQIAISDTRILGIVDSVGDDIDGYLAAADLDDVVRRLHLMPDTAGRVTLRVTSFDFDRVRELVDTAVVAALDAATSIDPRRRGAGTRMLAEVLESFR